MSDTDRNTSITRDETPVETGISIGVSTDRVGSADANQTTAPVQRRADQVRSGDVIVGFPVGPMTVRRAAAGTAHGNAVINITFEVYARMSVRPDRLFDVLPAQD